MFTHAQRQDIANRLIAAAEASGELTAGAVVGAAAAGRLDAFTGIDLLFAAAPDAEVADVREEWTRRMYREFGAVHHTADGAAAVHLLPDLLTARIEIVPADRFGSRPGQAFQQVFGAAGPQGTASSGAPDLVGPAWLAALRTRAALARRDGDAAAQHLAALRNALIALAGARTGAPAGYLEPADLDWIRAVETGSRDVPVLERAFGNAVQMLDRELQAIASPVADAVALPLLEEVAG